MNDTSTLPAPRPICRSSTIRRPGTARRWRRAPTGSAGPRRSRGRGDRPRGPSRRGATGRGGTSSTSGGDDFPLDTLRERLAGLRRDVLHGRGFMLLRGVPVERYTMRQSAIAYWGLGRHLGDPVSQNGKGHVLGHVTNLGLDYADPEVRGYQTRARLNYHADSSDVVALLCLRIGPQRRAVLDRQLDHRLERAGAPCAGPTPGPCSSRSATPAGERSPEKNRRLWAEIAAFTPWGGRMIATYVRSAIAKSQLMPEVPRLSPAQLEAMDHLDALAADPALHLDMAFRPGDVQVLCNHSILHSRTAYEDWPEAATPPPPAASLARVRGTAPRSRRS